MKIFSDFFNFVNGFSDMLKSVDYMEFQISCCSKSPFTDEQFSTITAAIVPLLKASGVKNCKFHRAYVDWGSKAEKGLISVAVIIPEHVGLDRSNVYRLWRKISPDIRAETRDCLWNTDIRNYDVIASATQTKISKPYISIIGNESDEKLEVEAKLRSYKPLEFKL